MQRALVVFFTFSFAILMSGSANAALTDLIGINKSIDQTILGMQAIVDQARAAALAIEAQTNQDVTARLDQIDTIVDKTVSDVKAIETQTFKDTNELVDHINDALSKRLIDISSLEKQFMSDLSLIIDKAECSIDRTLNQSVKDALGDVGKLIGTNRIEISPPLMYVGEHKAICIPGLQNCSISQTFDITTPFTTGYVQIRDYLIGRLDGARDDTPIESIVDTYQYMAELAKRTGCFMRGSQADYDADFVYYINKARQWRLVTKGGA